MENGQLLSVEIRKVIGFFLFSVPFALYLAALNWDEWFRASLPIGFGYSSNIQLGLFEGSIGDTDFDVCKSGDDIIVPFPNQPMNFGNSKLCNAIRATRAFLIMAVIALGPAAVLRIRQMPRASGACYFLSAFLGMIGWAIFTGQFLYDGDVSTYNSNQGGAAILGLVAWLCCIGSGALAFLTLNVGVAGDHAPVQGSGDYALFKGDTPA
eukprot:m.223942 g.223942  ORF g.223942 m.223942 type:complete len:210 (-) comp11006_c0_seq1:67-696(-)